MTVFDNKESGNVLYVDIAYILIILFAGFSG
jgi:hypothetical protein